MNFEEVLRNTWVVIPAHRAGSLIVGVLEDLADHGFVNILVVNDGSPDKTGEIINQDKRVKVALHHVINRGQGAALQTGFEYIKQCESAAEFVVTFDADGQHQAIDARRMVEKMNNEGSVDILMGSRFLGEAKNMSRGKRFELRLSVWFTRFMSGLKLTDSHNGLRVMRRRVLEKIQLHQDQMAHASEILDEVGKFKLRYEEFPVTISYSRDSREHSHQDRFMAGPKIAIKFLVGRLMH